MSFYCPILQWELKVISKKFYSTYMAEDHENLVCVCVWRCIKILVIFKVYKNISLLFNFTINIKKESSDVLL